MTDYHYAIIIPAWNEEAFIETCVTAVKEAMQGVPYAGQLIVVDNNSTDNTAGIAAAAGADVVFEPINQISRARNAGAAVAAAALNAPSYYVFIDADSHIDAPLLKAALDAMHENNAVGGGVMIRPDREPPFSARLTINAWNWLSRTFKLAAGCFIYTRADAFNDVGGFTLARYAGEELALSRALRRWGRRRDLQFHIITQHTIETSLRKLDWYSPSQLFAQFFYALLPGAMRSRRIMGTWYDESTKRTREK